MTRSGKKKQKNSAAPNNSNSGVAEPTRISVSKLLNDFMSSNDQVYTFEANLSNQERAAVHQFSRKLGMKSKSYGKGDQRRVTVSKTDKTGIRQIPRRKKNSVSAEEKENNISLITFSEESRRVLTDLFIHYPPGDDEAVKKNLNQISGNSSKSRGGGDDIFYKPVMNKAFILNKIESLASCIEKMPQLKEICHKRSKLPIASFQDAITSSISAHQVVLISGETGCGKTTQVPQYLLDYMWAKGEACKIVCTQPRRISAMSVAERISQERGESIGDTVGYKIRLDTKGGRQTSVMFCTNGVLLRVLVSGGVSGSQPGSSHGSSNRSQKVISQLTHIIVDEIHERDRYSDFMLAILRDLLPTYPHLRLVLMSATLDAERFSQYFGGCPVIRVPGFTHPVKSFYLEEILSILKTPEKNHLNARSTCPNEETKLSEEAQVALDEAIEMAHSNDEFDVLLELISSQGTLKVLNYQHSSTGVSPLMIFAGKGRVGDVCTLLSLGADCHLQARDGSSALNWAMREERSDTVEILKKHMEGSSTSSAEEQKLVEKYMSSINPELVDIVLVEKLLRKICTESQEGAILVFLPGWEEINKTRERLLANPFFKDSSCFLILALHSMIPSADQKKVFKRPPPGCRKIILSTNIAETSITIDDVVYVLDSGRMKEKSYDPYSNVSTLQSSWISKASGKQREGRAGRCQPGVCYHLYTRLRAVSFPEFQVPEIKRIPIEELCLQVKLLDRSCKVEVFLNKTLDPPVFETIKNAIALLQEIGAFTHDENLTDLGEKLGSLPVHPSTSKMLFFSILLNCLDPALTLACASDYKDPFTIPMLLDDKKKAEAAKAKLASFYGGYSDQLAVIAAFSCWNNAKQNGEEARFCSEYFVSSSTMKMLSGMRKQLLTELIRSGFVPKDVSTCSMNAQDPGIIRAVVLAGMYPMVGTLHPSRNNKRLIVETSSGDKVSLNSRSMNSKLSFKRSGSIPLLVYDEVTRGDGGLQTRNCTLIGPLSLLLIAKEIVVAPGKSIDVADVDIKETKEKIMSSPENAVTVVVDRWLSFRSTALEVAQIYCLRERLLAAILFKVTNPSDVLPPVLGASVYATACLMSYDGLNGISLSVDSMAKVPKDPKILVPVKSVGTGPKIPSSVESVGTGAEIPLSVESVETLTSMVNNTGIGTKKSGHGSKYNLRPRDSLRPCRDQSSHGNNPGIDASHAQNQPVRDGAVPSLSVPMVVDSNVSQTPNNHGPRPDISSHGNKLRKQVSRAQNQHAQAHASPSRSVVMEVDPPVSQYRNSYEPQPDLSLDGNKPRVQVSRLQNQPSRGGAPPSRSVSVAIDAPVSRTQQGPTFSPGLGSGTGSLAGYRSNMFGPYGPRGGSSKRPRGNKSG